VKIAILSDIHEGLNRKRSGADILGLLQEWVDQHTPDVLLISGDMASGPKKSLAYNTLLQFDGNLGNNPVHLNKEWVVVGDGGWYDYTFGIEGFTDEQFSTGQFNDFTWPDKIHAHWNMNDAAITRQYLARLENWLMANQEKNIILVSHFVPFAHFVQIKNDPAWDFFNAMMGSRGIGELAEKYGVKKLIFGHIHTRYHEEYNGIDCICNPLGYFPHEWIHDSAQEEIGSTIKVIDI